MLTSNVILMFYLITAFYIFYEFILSQPDIILFMFAIILLPYYLYFPIV